MENKGSAPQSSAVLVPGVGSSYKNGWNQLWKYFLELFLIFIVTLILQAPSWIGRRMSMWEAPTFTMLDLLRMAYSILILQPVGYGVSFAFLKAARGDKIEVSDVFEAFKNYWNAVLASLLVAAIVGIGFVFLIVPGIIFACKLAFTPYLVVDRKMEVIEAIKESWRMTNGHALEVFLIGLLAIPIVIAGLIVVGVGVIISAMWICLALASLYHAVSLTGKTPGQAAA